MPLSLALLVALVATAWAAPVGQPGAHTEAVDGSAGPAERLWLEVRTPEEGARIQDLLPLAPVRGRAGLGAARHHDVVLVIDVSMSTKLASGIDVDGDGRVGRASRTASRDWWRSFNPARLSSDPGDTILAAEIAAARRLLETMDPGSVRVGVVSFAGTARTEIPIESSFERVRAELEELRGHLGRLDGTNIGDGVRAALEALSAAPPDPLGSRRRVILYLSDGQANLPLGRPTEHAVEAAREAARSGVRINTFALGEEAIRGEDVLRAMSRSTGGTFTALKDPGAIVEALESVDFAGLARLEVENRTTGDRSRLVRTFADGSFDALVRIVPGENRIRVTARDRDGRETSVERTVVFEPIEVPDPARARERTEELRRMLQSLQRRTLEIEVLREMKRVRSEVEERERRLTIEVEADKP